MHSDNVQHAMRPFFAFSQATCMYVSNPNLPWAVGLQNVSFISHDANVSVVIQPVKKSERSVRQQAHHGCPSHEHCFTRVHSRSNNQQTPPLAHKVSWIGETILLSFSFLATISNHGCAEDNQCLPDIVCMHASHDQGGGDRCMCTMKVVAKKCRLVLCHQWLLCFASLRANMEQTAPPVPVLLHLLRSSQRLSTMSPLWMTQCCQPASQHA
jgi:hypothetical protein